MRDAEMQYGKVGVVYKRCLVEDFSLEGSLKLKGHLQWTRIISTKS
jgi:hypothetical protein